jgi:leucyl-tRNA synthetase
VTEAIAGGTGDNGVPSSRSALRTKTHQHLDAIVRDYSGQRLNTVVSSLMSLQRILSAAARAGEDRAEIAEGIEFLLYGLAPICPFITEELWARLGGDGSVHDRRLPEPEPSLLRAESTVLVVQVDGRVRDRIAVSPQISADEAVAAALGCTAVRTQLGDTAPARVIARPPGLVNIVTRL